MSESLESAREWLKERLETGARCPCCTQFAKVYRRKLNSGMARSLIRMYREGGVGWTHVPLDGREEGGKLSLWGLVEPGETRGMWRVTQLGEAFLLDLERVPSHAEIYDGTLLRLSGDPISITEAVGSHFDYTQLMSDGAPL